MYTQGTDYQTGGTTTTNYTTQQYNYQYQYQLPTTQTTTTTTTQKYTTTQPISYTEQITTSQPISYSQQYTVQQPSSDYTQSYTQQYTVQQQPTTDYTQSYTQQYTVQQPTTDYTQSYTQQYTVQQPTTDYTQAYTQQQTYTTTASVPGFAQAGFAQKPQPAFKLLRQGSGISPNEQRGIVSTAMAVYQSGITPISNNTASRIKKTLGGDWIVIVYAQGKPVDFNMTCVQGNDYMYFTLDNMAYQVCRLR